MSGVLNRSVDGEPFSSEDTFYRALVKGKYNKKGNVTPRAFSDSPDGTGPSVDWAKYSLPQETAARLASLSNTDAGLLPIKIASISAASIWTCGQDIEHSPRDDNYAHCMIVGDKDQVDNNGDIVRVRLSRAATIVYSLGE